MKILNLGSCNIDYVYSLDSIVTAGETVSAEGLEIFPGGKGLNQSVALARAGAEVWHAGCVGSDGAMLKEVLSQSGVRTEYLREVDGKNGQAIIQVNSDGENCIIIHEGSNGAVTPEYIDSVLEHFGQGDMLLLQNEVSRVDYAVERAYAKGIAVMLNPSPINEKIKAIDFNKLTYLVLNATEIKALTGCEGYEEGLKCLKESYPRLRIMLTLGGNGCVYYDGEAVCHPAQKVIAVDTTAAGDTFTGYFAAGIAEGLPIYEVLHRATVAAGISVTRKGAAPSIPTSSEVDAVIKEKKQ